MLVNSKKDASRLGSSRKKGFEVFFKNHIRENVSSIKIITISVVYKRTKISHLLPHYHFGVLKLAKPNCTTEMSESEEDGDES